MENDVLCLQCKDGHIACTCGYEDQKEEVIQDTQMLIAQYLYTVNTLFKLVGRQEYSGNGRLHRWWWRKKLRRAQKLARSLYDDAAGGG